MGQALDQEMFNYFTQLNEAEKKSVIEMLKTFLQSRAQKYEHISIEQYNQELNEAESEYEKGDFIKHEDLINLLSV